MVAIKTGLKPLTLSINFAAEWSDNNGRYIYSTNDMQSLIKKKLSFHELCCNYNSIARDDRSNYSLIGNY